MIPINRCSALILAAGNSSRMGTLKPLLPLDSETVLERVIDMFHAAGVGEVVVVVGHAADRIVPLLDGKNVSWVLNPAFERGMYSSVQAGVSALKQDCRAFFILPGDMPFIRPDTLVALAKGLDAQTRVCRPRHDHRRGHPPLLSATLIPDLLASHEEGGLRSFLARHEDGARDIDCDDPGIHIDLDTPEDYTRHRVL